MIRLNLEAEQDAEYKSRAANLAKVKISMRLFTVVQIAFFLVAPALARATDLPINTVNDREIAALPTNAACNTLNASPDRKTFFCVQSPLGLRGTERGKINLQVFDLSNPHVPRSLATLELGEHTRIAETAARPNRLFLEAVDSDPEGRNSDVLLIVNTSVPTQPILSGIFPLLSSLTLIPDLQASEDGHSAGLIGRPEFGGAEKVLLLVDATDAAHPNSMPTNDKPNLLPAGLTAAQRDRTQEALQGRLGDLHGAHALSVTKNRELLLWDMADPSKPRLMRSLGPVMGQRASLLETGDDAAVVEMETGPMVLDESERPFSAALLISAHADSLAVYTAAATPVPLASGRRNVSRKEAAELLKYDIESARQNAAENAVARLNENNVLELMDDDDRVDALTRVSILNDFGFWLIKAREAAQAVPVLRKVVALAPKRKAAWLNLGDAARTAIADTPNFADKQFMAKLATDAYASYQKQGGVLNAMQTAFISFNVGTAPTSNVCTYVADAYNHGFSGDIMGHPEPVDLLGDGKPVFVHLYWEGTASVPNLIASKQSFPEQSESEEYWPSQSDIDFNGDLSLELKDDLSLHDGVKGIVPFGKSYYILFTVSGGPLAVTITGKNTICRFHREFTPVMVEDHAPTICKAFGGKKETPVPINKLPRDSFQPARQDLEPRDYAHSTEMLLSILQIPAKSFISVILPLKVAPEPDVTITD